MQTRRALQFSDAVLVVDDETVILGLMATALAGRGFAVRTAANADDALQLIAAEAFGCVVCDKNLPGTLSGLDVLRKLREDQPYAACILVTGYASASSTVDALRLGATDYLEKPFDLDVLAHKVERAMAEARTRFDRAQLLSALEGFQAELDAKDAQLARQRTEVETLDALVEQRVAQATEDLRARCKMLSEHLASKRGLEAAEKVSLEEAVVLLHDIRVADTPESAPIRGQLARVARILESHLDLVISIRGRMPKP
jgi:DNA-binding response OmpR family regulator